MKYFLQNSWPLYVAVLVFSLLFSSPVLAQTPPTLGTSSTYGGFSGAGAIGNTGLTLITGDIGTNVGAFTGFPPGQYTGAKHVADAASLSAKNDLTLAYNSLNDATHIVQFDTALNATMGNGQILTSRTYGRGDLTTLSGTLTFDAQNNSSAVFIIKIAAALNVSKNTKIVLANGAQAANIYWAVDGAVSILDNTIFKGTILANGAIHLYGGTTLEGRALAVVGAITFASNQVSVPGNALPNKLIVITPAQGDTIKSGTQNYQITFGGTGIADKKTFEYSLDSGLTWKLIDSANSGEFSHAWNVPDTLSKKALIRITDANGLSGTSGLFVISRVAPSTLIVLRPSSGEVIVGGTMNYQITYKGTGIANKKTFEYSLDSGRTWKLIDTMTTTSFTHSWNVPDTSSTKALVRITDANGLSGVSGLFVISSSKTAKLFVIRPSHGEVVLGGSQNYQITFGGTGIADKKTFEYSLDSGRTWNLIEAIRSAGFTYSWNVPDTASKLAVVRITDSTGLSGKSGVFTIVSGKSPSLIITSPIAGEKIASGLQGYVIRWTGNQIAEKKMIELSLDNGTTWSLVEVIHTTGFDYSWNVPDTSSAMALIRITDSLGLRGTSGVFEIIKSANPGSINTLVLAGLTNNNIRNDKTLGITWTYTPEIGPNVTVEYQLDASQPWQPITTVVTTETTSVNWITPMAGYYPNARIRVTSTFGMSKTSSPFSIGIARSVASNLRDQGYTLSNFPNPAQQSTTIAFSLPIGGDVMLLVNDATGREVMRHILSNVTAGAHTFDLDASKLSSGVYMYRLIVGTAVLQGKMEVQK